jgi:hypothetical protein
MFFVPGYYRKFTTVGDGTNQRIIVRNRVASQNQGLRRR